MGKMIKAEPRFSLKVPFILAWDSKTNPCQIVKRVFSGEALKVKKWTVVLRGKKSYVSVWPLIQNEPFT